jgi:hypothetical protein
VLRFLRPSSFLLLVPALLSVGCASAPTAPSAQGWRPRPPASLAERCQGEEAQACYQEGLQLLAAVPPNAQQAQGLLAAACAAEVKSACDVLAARFHAPAAVKVPAVAGAPHYGVAVLEFTCQVTPEGSLEGCDRTASSNTDLWLDEEASRQVAAGQAASQFHPATLDGAPYATEVRLVYVLNSDSISGPQSTCRTSPNAATVSWWGHSFLGFRCW